jgi:hypothetical protein
MKKDGQGENKQNGARTRQATAVHGLTTQQFAWKDNRKYSYAVKVVGPWNQLPDSIKQAESKEAFNQEGFETTEEIVTAYNSPAGRLIDGECSG